MFTVFIFFTLLSFNIKGAEIEESKMITYRDISFTYSTRISDDLLFISSYKLNENLSGVYFYDLTNGNTGSHESTYFTTPKIQFSNDSTFSSGVISIILSFNDWTSVSDQYDNLYWRLQVSTTIAPGSSELETINDFLSRTNNMAVIGLTRGDFISIDIAQQMYDQGRADGLSDLTDQLSEYGQQQRDAGYQEGFEDAFWDIYENGLEGFSFAPTVLNENSFIWGNGYQVGYDAGSAFDALAWLKSLFYLFTWILTVQIIPGLSILTVAGAFFGFIVLILVLKLVFGGGK